jgi:hypothetical protein
MTYKTRILEDQEPIYPVTVLQLMRELSMSDTGREDVEDRLKLTLMKASGAVESKLGRSLMRRQYRTQTDVPCYELSLIDDVYSIISVTIGYLDGTSTILTENDYTITLTGITISEDVDLTDCIMITVVYLAGMAYVPEVIQAGILLVAKHIWQGSATAWAEDSDVMNAMLSYKESNI